MKVFQSYLKCKRNILTRFLSVFSLSTAAFIFQACYGTPQDMKPETNITGVIKSEVDNEPVKGIRISVLDNSYEVFSDTAGKFELYLLRDSLYTITCSDIDGEQHGSFKDTTITLQNNRLSAELNTEVLMKLNK